MEILFEYFLNYLFRNYLRIGKTEGGREVDIKETILEGTLQAYRQKGIKFTMDDIAGILGMSKKTIYTVFTDKEALFLAMVDYLFDKIKVCEQEIMDHKTMSTTEKLRRILGVMPDVYQDVDFGQLYVLKEKYPKTYAQVEKRLETGWESTILLLEKGMEEGVLRPIKIPVFKTMMEAALEEFFQRDILVRNQISFTEALNEVVGILIDGITVRDR